MPRIFLPSLSTSTERTLTYTPSLPGVRHASSATLIERDLSIPIWTATIPAPGGWCRRHGTRLLSTGSTDSSCRLRLDVMGFRSQPKCHHIRDRKAVARGGIRSGCWQIHQANIAGTMTWSTAIAPEVNSWSGRTCNRTHSIASQELMEKNPIRSTACRWGLKS
jgi:hypothetical protein